MSHISIINEDGRIFATYTNDAGHIVKENVTVQCILTACDIIHTIPAKCRRNSNLSKYISHNGRFQIITPNKNRLEIKALE